MPPAWRIRDPETMDDPARRHQQIQAELAQIGLILPGSLTDRTTRCQRAGCHCHADPPQLHGPYPTWTRKISGRTITRTLTLEHPGFGGDSILPRCSGLGDCCLPRYRRLAEPRSDHFSASGSPSKRSYVWEEA